MRFNLSQNDPYTKQAKAEGYPARSVYKLKEIDTTFRLLKKGQRVLDLGCTPGSWLMYIAQRIGDSGMVVGVDQTPLSLGQGQTPSQVGRGLPLSQTVFLNKNVFDDDLLKESALQKKFLYRNIYKYNKDPDTKKGDRGKLVFPVAEILKPQGVKNISSEAERAIMFDVVVSDLAPKTTGMKERDAFASLELCQKAFEIAKKVLVENGAFVCKIFESQETNYFINELKNSFKAVKRYKPKAVLKQSREFFIVALGFSGTGSAPVPNF